MNEQPKNAGQITAFQKECLAACQSVLKRALCPGVTFHEQGEKERYFTARIQLPNQVLEIYIYADGAEFNLGNRWTRLERYDYKTLGNLTQDFCTKLAAGLANVNSEYM